MWLSGLRRRQVSSGCEVGAGFESRSCLLALHVNHASLRDSNWNGPLSLMWQSSHDISQRDLKQQQQITLYVPCILPISAAPWMLLQMLANTGRLVSRLPLDDSKPAVSLRFRCFVLTVRNVCIVLCSYLHALVIDSSWSIYYLSVIFSRGRVDFAHLFAYL